MPNRLISESSPYLRKHSEDLVDWYPWGQEAFDRAKQEDKVIFLSSGYIACHWCNAMQEESFKDPAIAEFLNANFVNVKVDKEERVDIDKIYMPFYGGSYYPPNEALGKPTFITVLRSVLKRWTEDREQVIQNGQSVVDALIELDMAKADALVSHIDDYQELARQAISKSLNVLTSAFDIDNGGFGNKVKFPNAIQMLFLHRYDFFYESPNAMEMSLYTCNKMIAGAIHDHIGKGIHRGTLDARWHMPFFEKELVDQAQTLFLYAEAYAISQSPAYKKMCEEIVEFVTEQLSLPGGGFAHALSADSYPDSNSTALVEGVYYAWTRKEVDDLLHAEPLYCNVFCAHFGITEDGNVPREYDPRGHLYGKNVLFERCPLAITASQFDLEESAVHEIVENVKQQLRVAQKLRPRPLVDDRAMSSTNGLMIISLVVAGRYLGEPKYLDMAVKAAEFVRNFLWIPWHGSTPVAEQTATPRLRHGFAHGRVLEASFCGDYAHMVDACLTLYEAIGDETWLEWAIEMQNEQETCFSDKDTGSYWTSKDTDDTIVRVKDDRDGPEQSANSTSYWNLVRLGAILKSPLYIERAQRLLLYISTALKEAPQNQLGMALHLFGLEHGVTEVIIRPSVTEVASTAAAPLTNGFSHKDQDNDEVMMDANGTMASPAPRTVLQVIGERFDPGCIRMWAKPGLVAQQNKLVGSILAEGAPTDGSDKSAVYVCRGRDCFGPLTKPEDLSAVLDRH
ncbi:spermatogenesis-associated protein 20 [Sorochytrium milnesiophthora]